jgi:hypothetical protein
MGSEEGSGSVNAVYFLHSGFKNICQYLEVKSIFENNLGPALLRSSMLSSRFFIEYGSSKVS